MSLHPSDSNPIDVNQHVVRSFFSMLLLLEPPDATALPTKISDVSAIANCLQWNFAQWVWDNQPTHKRLMWLGCPRGEDATLFEAQVQRLMAHFDILNYASIRLMEDCVQVTVLHEGQEHVSLSPGTLVTPEWQARLLSQLLGADNAVQHLRPFHTHENPPQPQTNMARLARQIKAQQLIKDLGLHSHGVL